MDEVFDIDFDLDDEPHGGAVEPHHAAGYVLHGEILKDPGVTGWPPTLALEIAMQSESVREICEGHRISRERWGEIRLNPVFVAELTAAIEALRKEGAAFRARAHLQSLELLKTSWHMIHDRGTPHAVRADLLKFTVKAAGLDASKDQGIGKAAGSGFQILIRLD